MGQKVNAHGFRVGVSKPWDAKWYAEKDYAALLNEDVKIREFLRNSYTLQVFPAVKSNALQNVSNWLSILLNRAWSSAVAVQVLKILKKR